MVRSSLMNLIVLDVTMEKESLRNFSSYFLNVKLIKEMHNNTIIHIGGNIEVEHLSCFNLVLVSIWEKFWLIRMSTPS